MSEPIRDEKDLLREALGRTPECPALEVLTAPQHDAEVQRHVEGCPHCRAELALFHHFESADAQPGEAADLVWIESELARRSPVASTSGESFGDRLRAWLSGLLLPANRGRLALAAATLVILVTAGIFRQSGTGVRPAQPEEPNVWRSSQIAAVSPLGDVEQAPSQLRWEAVPGATSYRVRLLEVDGTEIWAADAAAAAIDFPDNLRSKLRTGRAFQWDAVARDPSGRQLATTNLQVFHIVPTQR